MRKLASTRQISELNPILGADLIEAATVDGWQVVVKRGEFAVGDIVVYLEIDSWVPTDLAEFLSKGREPREYNGVKGERLRTIRLRGQVSQGLIINLNDAELRSTLVKNNSVNLSSLTEIGLDLTDDLGIQKWEAPISAQLQGKARGNFPSSLIPKTDEERIQNCFGNIQNRDGKSLTKKIWNAELQLVEEYAAVLPDDFLKPTYEVTMKLDGSSMTLFRWEDQLRVCSRNLELIIDDENAGNSFVAMAMTMGDMVPNGFAFQGELMGPGIQGNREGFSKHRFFVFNIVDIAQYRYLGAVERRALCTLMGFEHTPVYHEAMHAPNSVVEGLALAEGPSINHKIREGLVWKCLEDPGFSFKTISNQYLLKSEL